MRYLVLALLLCLVSPTIASEIGLGWDASTGATGYDVGIGSVPGEYTPPHIPVPGALLRAGGIHPAAHSRAWCAGSRRHCPWCLCR